MNKHTWNDDQPRPPRGARRSRYSRRKQRQQWLDGLADRLRQVYTLERRDFEAARGRTYNRPSARFEQRQQDYDEYVEPDSGPTWRSIAYDLHQRRIDPVDYVRRLFGMLRGRPGAAPSPAELLQPRATRLYEEGIKTTRSEVDVAFVVQKRQASRQIRLQQTLWDKNVDEATLAVLFDETLPLSALFRYCLARSMRKKRFRPVCQRYREEAAHQYMRRREDYDAVWGKWIPEDFQHKATVIYQRALQRLS